MINRFQSAALHRRIQVSITATAMKQERPAQHHCTEASQAIAPSWIVMAMALHANHISADKLERSQCKVPQMTITNGTKPLRK